jgi:hypothetical protein
MFRTMIFRPIQKKTPARAVRARDRDLPHVVKGTPTAEDDFNNMVMHAVRSGDVEPVILRARTDKCLVGRWWRAHVYGHARDRTLDWVARTNARCKKGNILGKTRSLRITEVHSSCDNDWFRSFAYYIEDKHVGSVTLRNSVECPINIIFI